MSRSNLFLVGGVIIAALAIFLNFDTENAKKSKVADLDNKLNIYNWSDYIAEDTISNFEAETGIKVTYDMYDSNEVLEAKMLAGSSGYDLVVPTADFLARGREAGAYQDMDMSKISNVKNQSPQIQAQADEMTGSTNAGLVYMWGSTGIAYNEEMIAERLGDDAPIDSWALILDPVNAAKLEDCGIAVLDAPTDVLPNIMTYLGYNGTSTEEAHFEAAGEALTAIRPYLRYINSSQSINDIANGDICAAIMWSGDAFQAAYRAEEAENGNVIDYYIPNEGTNLWFDVMAIPADAKNVENAHKFVDYMMRADVAAENVNYVWYASGNKAAEASIDPEILSHPGIYPTDEAKEKLFVTPVYDAKTDRVVTRVWNRFLAGN